MVTGQEDFDEEADVGGDCGDFEVNYILRLER